MLEHLDIAFVTSLFLERGLNRAPGGVGGVDDAAVTVAALAGQVIVVGRGIVLGEGHPITDEFADRVLGVLHHEAHHPGIAQPAAGHQRVGHMAFQTVGGVKHRGDATLGVERAGIGEIALRQQSDAGMRRELQRHGEPRGARADHQHIMQRHFVHGVSQSRPISTAGADWVRRPTEM